MKAIVRDDIIGLESYVEAEFKYKEYIEVIAECGGYCFIEQIERIWKDKGGRYLVQKMEDAKLVKTDYFSKYKYLRLTANALKYLHYRDDERDFSDIPKNKISVQNLKSKPSEKVLFTSVMNFEHSKGGIINKLFLKRYHIGFLEGNLKIDNTSKIDALSLELSNLREEYFKHKFAISSHNNIYQKIKQSNQELYDEIKSLKAELLLLKEQTGFFKNNENKIKDTQERIDELSKLVSSNNSDLKAISSIEEDMNILAREHNSTEKEIESLKLEQETKNKSADELISKLSKIRDVSKLICALDKGSELYIYSTFVKYHKSNYSEIIKDLIKLFREYNIKITFVKLHLISIFEPPKRMNFVIKKIEDNYKGTSIEFHCSLIRTKHLEKYFDTIQDNIGYIKEDHIEQFANLKDKLSKK